MKQQVLIIGGGTTFRNYDEYFDYLKNSNIELKRLKDQKSWKDNITQKLGENFEVFISQMPNRSNAQYQEWQIVFEKVLPLLKNDLILIGHSLGGIFLAKYLSQNNISSKIKSLILISAPFNEEGSQESLGDFCPGDSIIKLGQWYEKVCLIHSEDDKVVSFCQVKKYQKFLPKAKLIIFKDRGHFNQETFPELIKLITHS
jgi:predicted alpha/beta hydrolase family esterase